MAAAVKHGLEQQEVPDAKRQKALSKASLAAMAAIAATARLPSQVMKLLHLHFICNVTEMALSFFTAFACNWIHSHVLVWIDSTLISFTQFLCLLQTLHV